MGLTGIGLLRALALILRVLGNGSRHLGTLAQRIYDLPLFVPLWIETRMAAAAAAEEAANMQAAHTHAANMHMSDIEAPIDARSWQEAQS